MKRMYLARRNALFPVPGLSPGSVGLGVVLVLLIVRLVTPNLFWWIFSPVIQMGTTVTTQTHIIFSGFADNAVLAAKNDELEEHNAALISENQTLLQKVANLSALISPGTTSQNDDQGILAAVVARPPQSPYDTLILAAGSDSGVSVGMEVFGSGGVPLGMITQVYGAFSQLTLFSAPGVVTAGWIGTGTLPVTMRGIGGGSMTASVAREARITENDRVFVPGPGMLFLGTIVRIESDSSSPSVTLRIAPAINLFTIGWVTIRTTGAPVFTLSSTTDFHAP